MVFLIDINALLALAWPNHPHHETATGWFASVGEKGWATCATTELGFVRISSQPKFSRHHATPEEACRMLHAWVGVGKHAYWREDANGLRSKAFSTFLPAVTSHHHVTDAFLAAVSIANGGRLATLDRPLKRLFPDVVELIGD